MRKLPRNFYLNKKLNYNYTSGRIYFRTFRYCFIPDRNPLVGLQNYLQSRRVHLPGSSCCLAGVLVLFHYRMCYLRYVTVSRWCPSARFGYLCESFVLGSNCLRQGTNGISRVCEMKEQYRVSSTLYKVYFVRRSESFATNRVYLVEYVVCIFCWSVSVDYEPVYLKPFRFHLLYPSEFFHDRRIYIPAPSVYSDRLRFCFGCLPVCNKGGSVCVPAN